MPAPYVLRLDARRPNQFGAALSAEGDRLLVGSPYRYFLDRREDGVAPPAAAYFTRAGASWTLT